MPPMVAMICPLCPYMCVLRSHAPGRVARVTSRPGVKV